MHDRRAGVWRWPVLSLLYLVVAATLSQYIGLRSVGYGDRVIVGLLETGVLLAFAALIAARVQARKESVVDPALAGAAVSAGGARAETRAAEWPARSPRSVAERVPASSVLHAGAEAPPGGPPSPPWSPVSQVPPSPLEPGNAPAFMPAAPPSVPLAPPTGFGPFGAPGPSSVAAPPPTPPTTPPTAPYQPRWPGDPRTPDATESRWPGQSPARFQPQSPAARGWGNEPGPTPPQER